MLLINPGMKQIKLTIISNNQYYKLAVEQLIDRHEKYSLVPFDLDQMKLKKTIDVQENVIVILDFINVDLNIVKALREACPSYSSIKIIVVSGDKTLNFSGIVYKLGLSSHINHTDGLKELAKAIKIVNEGGTYISQKMTDSFEQQLLEASQTKVRIADSLTDQEKRLVNLILDGLSSKEIGILIHRSHRTVEDLRKKLYTKLQVKNKMELLKLLANNFF